MGLHMLKHIFVVIILLFAAVFVLAGCNEPSNDNTNNNNGWDWDSGGDLVKQYKLVTNTTMSTTCNECIFFNFWRKRHLVILV